VLVLTDGVIALDEPVDVPSPRLRGNPAFLALRSRLLAALGVDEAAEGARPSPTDGPAGSPTDPPRPSPNGGTP